MPFILHIQFERVRLIEFTALVNFLLIKSAAWSCSKVLDVS